MKERNAAEFTLWAVIGLIITPTTFGWAALPKSLADGPPAFLSHAVLAVLWLGCVGAIAGMAWRDRIDGDAIQQVALVAIAVGAFSYAAALAAASIDNPANALLAVGFVGGVGMGALARYGQIRGWWRRVSTYLRSKRVS